VLLSWLQYLQFKRLHDPQRNPKHADVECLLVCFFQLLPGNIVAPLPSAFFLKLSSIRWAFFWSLLALDVAIIGTTSVAWRCPSRKRVAVGSDSN